MSNTVGTFTKNDNDRQGYTKKRKIDPLAWKDTVNRDNRARGEPYQITRGPHKGEFRAGVLPPDGVSFNVFS